MLNGSWHLAAYSIGVSWHKYNMKLSNHNIPIGMASDLTIYSIYKSQDDDKHYLLKTERRAYSNASQSDADLAELEEQDIRRLILEKISLSKFTLLGEMQGYPVGYVLYADCIAATMDIYYMQTEFGYPWVVLGNADSEEEFLAELNDDEDLLRLKPTGQPIKINVSYLAQHHLHPSVHKPG
ncbi:hypothetical protein VF12_40695 [Nostoc linckia z15]|nr:hypothetical protein VF12_40695 [Nostoc linckia z15]